MNSSAVQFVDDIRSVLTKYGLTGAVITVRDRGGSFSVHSLDAFSNDGVIKDITGKLTEIVNILTDDNLDIEIKYTLPRNGSNTNDVEMPH